MEGTQNEPAATVGPSSVPAAARGWRLESQSMPAQNVEAADQRAGRVWRQVESAYITAALLASLGFLYLSTIPWIFAAPDLDSRLEGVWESLRWDPAQPLDPFANVLAFIPVGFLWSAAWCTSWPKRRARATEMIPVAMGCLLLAILAETLQFWIPLRDPSIRDVLALEFGAMIGCGLWRAVGERATSQLCRMAEPVASWAERRSTSWLQRSALYCALYLACVGMVRFANPIQLFLTYRDISTSLQNIPLSRPDLGTPWPRSPAAVVAVAAALCLLVIGVCRFGSKALRSWK